MNMILKKVSWKTKKQHMGSCSSAETEYRAMAHTLCELKWLKAFFKTFGFGHSHMTLIHCDNQATIRISANPMFHEKTKHIEADYHQVRDTVQDRTIAMHHIFTITKDQLADLLTKFLLIPTFERLLSRLRVEITYHNLRGVSRVSDKCKSYLQNMMLNRIENKVVYIFISH